MVENDYTYRVTRTSDGVTISGADNSRYIVATDDSWIDHVEKIMAHIKSLEFFSSNKETKIIKRELIKNRYVPVTQLINKKIASKFWTGKNFKKI